VTLAPELPGCLDLVRELCLLGISVSAGHSDATENEALAGFAAGISQVTHLHNAMSSIRKTSPPRRGLAEASLGTPGICCELIAVGVHVPAELLREAWLAKGWEGIVLVSDATAGAGLADGALFRLGELSCRVEGNVAWTTDGEGHGRCLAGSTSCLIDGVRTMVETIGVPLVDAVAMATMVPARLIGREGEVGSLKPGKSADLVRFSKEWQVRGVWISGN
jgi:N-acetylglucosamine-6-phosphate deacetylase